MNNLTKRVIAGIIGIPIILFVCYKGGLLYGIFALMVSSIALWEFLSMFEKTGLTPLKITGVLLSSVVIILNYYPGVDLALLMVISFLIIMITELLRKTSRNPINSFIVASGLLYITVPFVLFGRLNEFSTINVMILVFVMIWTCDTAAYFGGKFFGKHKLTSVSPGKTVEGSAAGLIFTILASVLFHYFYPEDFSLKQAVILGVITGIFSQAGDLFESMIKRYCGFKDSSGIIPGHGGMLDRFDSLFFTAPALYVFLKLFNYF